VMWCKHMDMDMHGASDIVLAVEGQIIHGQLCQGHGISRHCSYIQQARRNKGRVELAMSHLIRACFSSSMSRVY
jgi:hypothetical protein